MHSRTGSTILDSGWLEGIPRRFGPSNLLARGNPHSRHCWWGDIAYPGRDEILWSNSGQQIELRETLRPSCAKIEWVAFFL